MTARKTLTKTTPRKPRKAPSPSPRPFGEHIVELRNRLLIVALAFLVTSAIAYAVRDSIISFILAPIGSEKLVYLTPGGGFTFVFEVSIYTGALFAAPVAIYHLYRFIAPALPSHARHHTVRLLLCAIVLMTLGVVFGYFIAIPGALRFLTEFADGWVVANLTADSYLNFVVAYLLGLGFTFELPLLLILWNQVTPIGPGTLLKSQRYVIAGSFVAAAIITPTPDALNQCLIALPIILIYQVGVITVWIQNRKKRQFTSPPLPTVQAVYPTDKPAVGLSAPLSDTSPSNVDSLPTVRTKRTGTIDGFKRTSKYSYRPTGKSSI